MANGNVEERLKKEVTKRVEYYEQNGVDESEKMGKAHYAIAIVVAAIGLAMTILGAVLK